MATATAKPEVFTRKASGLVRVMSPYSAFVYNILTMGIIFPWVFLVSPTAFPGGNVPLGILICTLIQIPIAFAAVWLSTALPRSGGDYVFQSRVLGGGWGYTIVMSGFVIWILVVSGTWTCSEQCRPDLSRIVGNNSYRSVPHQLGERLAWRSPACERIQKLRPLSERDVDRHLTWLRRYTAGFVCQPGGGIRIKPE